MTRIIDMRRDLKGRGYNVTSSDDACLPITRQIKVAETPKLARRLSVPWLTFRTSSKVRRTKVKVTRPLDAENQPYLRNEKACKSPTAGGRGNILAAQLQAAQLACLYSNGQPRWRRPLSCGLRCRVAGLGLKWLASRLSRWLKVYGGLRLCRPIADCMRSIRKLISQPTHF